MLRTRGEFGPRLHTTLSCGLSNRRPVLFLPPEMGALQPRSLGYLRAFARQHGFGLIEDRRRRDLRPIVEQRAHELPKLALGVSFLLKQTGMPGGERALSNPHRLHADGLYIELVELVRMAARSRGDSKRVVILPNRMIMAATGEDTHPIVAHACRLETPEAATILSQFESPAFRCLGYSTGRQYVVHAFLAGGVVGATELWARLHTLAQTDFRFRLFFGQQPTEDFGLFHKTFYFDLASSGERPWWLGERQDDIPEERENGSDSPLEHSELPLP